jgi:hypothetical protein
MEEGMSRLLPNFEPAVLPVDCRIQDDGREQSEGLSQALAHVRLACYP